MMGRICLRKWSLIRAAMVEPAASHLRHAGLVHPSQRDPFGPPRAGRTGAHRRCREQSLCHLDGLRSGQDRACLGEAARFRPMRALNRASTCHSNQTPSPGPGQRRGGGLVNTLVSLCGQGRELLNGRGGREFPETTRRTHPAGSVVIDPRAAGGVPGLRPHGTVQPARPRY
jgi:hypothetical protein